MLRVVNLVKVFSALLFLGTLLLIYAYLPIMVRMDPQADYMVQKELFFYYALFAFVLLNALILFLQSMINQRLENEILQSWIGGFTFVFNMYLAFLVAFLGVLNNSAHIDASGYAYLNWLGPIMIFSWVFGLIFILWKKNSIL